jgi:hypothetical protein
MGLSECLWMKDVWFYECRAQIFWQVLLVQQPVQYGRGAAHISWAAWVLKPLEDYMNERQHHLNESSSARLGRSQKLEILPSPNSKQTRSLGANFLTGHSFGTYILISAEILTSALFLSYIMWPSNFTIPHSFATYICRLYLPPTFATYILEVRLHFEQALIFWQFFAITFAWFCCCKYLCIFSVFIYAFLCAPIFLAQLFWSLGLRLM